MKHNYNTKSNFKKIPLSQQLLISPRKQPLETIDKKDLDHEKLLKLIKKMKSLVMPIILSFLTFVLLSIPGLLLLRKYYFNNQKIKREIHQFLNKKQSKALTNLYYQTLEQRNHKEQIHIAGLFLLAILMTLGLLTLLIILVVVVYKK